MDLQEETNTAAETGYTLFSFCCKVALFCLALLYILSRMCFDRCFGRPKKQLDYYRGERTVIVAAPGGSRIVAHKKERVEKGRMVEAEGSVTQYGSNGGEPIWSRQWAGNMGQ